MTIPNEIAQPASRLRSLTGAGQSVWLDFITRDLVHNGELARLIELDSVSGVTSNPAIFEKAIAAGASYEDSIVRFTRRGMTPLQIYEALAIDDIRSACDLLKPVYERTHARDGYVSLEVNPHLAQDAPETLLEARRLFSVVDRPNVMIKIPGTAAALPAITEAIADGVNVNVTLIFSVERYEQVLDAWLAGLEAAGRDSSKRLSQIASVASFFISRVDSVVDPRLQALGPGHTPLLGLAGIANATSAYSRFLGMCESDRFRALASRGAQVQRPLWASTSPKNASYSDVVYAERLVARNTVNTLPPQTLQAFRAYGEVRSNLASAAAQADALRVLEAVADAGVDLKEIAAQLEREGLVLFANAFDSLLQTISGRSAAA